jgi:hypothetical protein
LAWCSCFTKDTDITIEGEKNDKRKLIIKKSILRYRSIGLSTRSGKTDEKKKKVDGIKAAAQKTSRNLKVANTGSLVWSI